MADSVVPGAGTRHISVEAELAAWSATRPPWQQDVIARLCQQEVFDHAAIGAIADNLVAGEKSAFVPIAAADVPGGTVADDGVYLTALRDLAGVNALAGGQELRFGQDGLTIIYGDNACGKSGYARLLKSAVGARVACEVLGNVFEAGPLAPMAALVDYRVGTSLSEEEWKWPGEANQALRQVHFWDEACGKAYLTTTSELTYRPSALVLLDQLIVICDAASAELGSRLRANAAARTDLPATSAGSPAHAFLARLSKDTTCADIDAACVMSDQDAEDLGALLTEEARLKVSNPAKEKIRLRSLAKDVSLLAEHCDHLATSLSADELGKLQAARGHATEMRAAAALASSHDFEAEPVDGVGSETWRSLWVAAKAFSEAEAYHGHEFPVTGDGSFCVLCQQELSSAGRGRLARFQTFMTDTTERDAAVAEKNLDNLRAAIGGLGDVTPAVQAARAQVAGSEPELAGIAEAYLAAAAKLLAEAGRFADRVIDELPSGLASGPAAQLRARAAELLAAAGAVDAASFQDSLDRLAVQVQVLQSRAALAGSREAVKRETERLRVRARIETAQAGTSTAAITRKATALIKSQVTDLVRDRFTRETEQFRLRRITINPTAGVKGRLKHQPSLMGAAVRRPVTEVFSEGEQTALGLAGFITEVEFDATKSAVVLDDPVTSLDHVRRTLVARRLAELARSRQVVIFTHEVTFVGALVKCAEEAHVAVTERCIQRRGEEIGFCTDKFPWKAKDVPTRLDYLRVELGRLTKDRGTILQEEYEQRCQLWGGFLSETWERAVNLEIVYQVVDRGTSEVRPRQFRILSKITEQDNEEFQAGYGQSSQWAPRHDKDPEINFVAPEPADMETELDRFKQWFDRVKGYKANK